MLSWFSNLPVIEQVFYYIALPSTAILVIQTLLLLVGQMGPGSGDTGLDSDTSGIGYDGDSDFDSGFGEAASADIDDIGDIDDGSGLDSYGLRFFTLRGIIAFLTIAGWSGVCLIEFGASNGAAVIFSILLGILAMVALAYLIRSLLKLQRPVVFSYKSALGQTGEAYIPIPPSGEGKGKVSIVMNGAFSQYDAVTTGQARIATGQLVRIVDVQGSTLVVEAEENL